jgi:hypothetical protein
MVTESLDVISTSMSAGSNATVGAILSPFASLLLTADIAVAAAGGVAVSVRTINAVR